MNLYDNFNGKIDGITIQSARQDFYKNYNHVNHNSRERTIDVNNFMKKYKDFFNKYIERVYNPNINSKSLLSDGLNGCQFLASLTTYIVRGDISELEIKGNNGDDKAKELAKEKRSYYNFDII